METNFKDNFSKQSDIYLKYRPHYPIELFAFLASLSRKHELVWDCGTGNGQAATGLADFFDKVIATDPSEQQIKNAIPHKNVTYKVEKAENNSLEQNSADLVTVANALHWFDHDAFYKEARRVLKPNAIIAAWAYGVPTISEKVDLLVNDFHNLTLGEYWQAENRLVEKEYTTLPFPFDLIDTPGFTTKKIMNLDEFVGYLNSWSATQRFINKNNSNPTEELKDKLKSVWDKNIKTVSWKLILKVGRV